MTAPFSVFLCAMIFIPSGQAHGTISPYHTALATIKRHKGFLAMQKDLEKGGWEKHDIINGVSMQKQLLQIETKCNSAIEDPDDPKRCRYVFLYMVPHKRREGKIDVFRYLMAKISVSEALENEVYDIEFKEQVPSEK